MTKTFTVTDWNLPVTLADGKHNGLPIPYDEFNIQYPIVQVYKDHGNNELQLIMDSIDFAVSLVNNDVILISREPFNGVVVIK